MPKKKSKLKKTIKEMKRDFNILIGTILFILLIGSAFTIDWLFGVFFIIGFIISILNKTLEHKPLIPILLFVGGLIIRIALFIILPRVIEAKNYWSLGIAGILFAILLIIGWRLQRGKV